MNSWRPSASIAALKKRAAIMQTIREFFWQRGVLEVETPSLARFGVSDLHLENLTTEFQGPGYPKPLELSLQSSPEYAMKRLLAAGSGDIFQICKAFRDDESGRYHNPEFTLLEWYRLNYTAHQMMAETSELISQVLCVDTAQILTYQEAFIQWLKFDPLDASVQDIKACFITQGEAELSKLSDDKHTLLQLAFSHFIEPQIGQDKPCFIYQFPAEQASLARLNTTDTRVAERFELYYKGIELANGFDELTDPAQQYQRFVQDNELRQKQGKKTKAIDTYLIEALKSGLPDCAGIALGLDRLVMLALDVKHIDQVIAFPLPRC